MSIRIVRDMHRKPGEPVLVQRLLGVLLWPFPWGRRRDSGVFLSHFCNGCWYRHCQFPASHSWTATLWFSGVVCKQAWGVLSSEPSSQGWITIVRSLGSSMSLQSSVISPSEQDWRGQPTAPYRIGVSWAWRCSRDAVNLVWIQTTDRTSPSYCGGTRCKHKAPAACNGLNNELLFIN